MPCAHGSPGAALGQRVSRSRRRRSSSTASSTWIEKGSTRTPGILREVLEPVLGPDLQVLFVGINPSLRSAEVGHHFARPGNRFYPALHAAGFTPRQFAARRGRRRCRRYGVGSTNIAAAPDPRGRRAQPRGAARGRAGARARWSPRIQPRLVAVLGLGAYRTAFERPKATMGPQEERIGGRPVWILPNPSGLNAHYKPADFARLYGEARLAAERMAPGG